MAVNKQSQLQVETLVRKDSCEKSHVYYYYYYFMVGLLAFNLFFVNIFEIHPDPPT